MLISGAKLKNTNLVYRPQVTYTIGANTNNFLMDVSFDNRYLPGQTDITINILPNTYVTAFPPAISSGYSAIDWTNTSALTIVNAKIGDSVVLNNFGNILGYGGEGGGLSVYSAGGNCTPPPTLTPTTPQSGGSAISIFYPLTINNYGYIAGGGGGGGQGGAWHYDGVSFFYSNWDVATGGGGAGGGAGGRLGESNPIRITLPNLMGANGTQTNTSWDYYCNYHVDMYGLRGGGGGFDVPGTGGSGIVTSVNPRYSPGAGGGTGGSGAVTLPDPNQGGTLASYTLTGAGGSANNNAVAVTPNGSLLQAGAGGGWAASGGTGYNAVTLNQVGAVGGPFITSNNNVVIINNRGTIYGTQNNTISGTQTLYYRIRNSSIGSYYLDLAVPYAIGRYYDIVVEIDSGVTLLCDDRTQAALQIYNSTSGLVSSLKLIINGNVLGAGGPGGDELATPYSGGDAIWTSFSCNKIIIDCSNGYLAGGGGGGGCGNNTGPTQYTYGGGGAGGGSSGRPNLGYGNYSIALGLGATIANTPGANGNNVVTGGITYVAGGGGGLVVPGSTTYIPALSGSGVIAAGIGGTSGGTGGFIKNDSVSNLIPNNYGGGFNQLGGYVTTITTNIYGGGGGGWGAAGGRSRATNGRTIQTGAAGGYYLTRGLPNSTHYTGDQIFIINPYNHIAGTFNPS
jgi:hypothetical protein